MPPVSFKNVLVSRLIHGARPEAFGPGFSTGWNAPYQRYRCGNFRESQERGNGWPKRLGHCSGIPRLLGGDSLERSLMGTFGVLDVVELGNLGLDSFVGSGHGLLVQTTTQGLVDASIFPWVVGLWVRRWRP